MSYQDILAGTVERSFTVIARATGAGITSGTVEYFLLAESGANAGKWYRDSDGTWQESATGNAMSHLDDGHWKIELAASPFVAGVRFLEYVKESGGLHVPTGRHLVTVSPGVVVGPVAGVVPGRVVGADLSLYLGELRDNVVSVVDANGAAVDLSGRALRVVIEKPTGGDVQVVESAAITISGDDSNVVTFRNTVAVTASRSVWFWSLWDVTGDPELAEVLVAGRVYVERAGVKDV